MPTVLILGAGLQGRAVIHDLAGHSDIDTLVIGELDIEGARAAIPTSSRAEIRPVAIDATQADPLRALLRRSAPDVVVSMLPPALGHLPAQLAIEQGAHYVSSCYTRTLSELDAAARAAGVTVLPEMGLDPGIDLLLGQIAVAELDEVHALDAYGGGIPEPACADANPLHYKITWTFEGVLTAYVRTATLLRDGRELTIAATDIFHPDHRRAIDVPGVGKLEAYPNGEALGFIDTYGLGPELKEMGRYSLRWPGHCDFWYPLVQLGLLDDTPVDLGEGLGRQSPRRLLARQLEPRLQFGDDERDVTVLRVHARGLAQGEPKEVVLDVVDYRDLDTGLYAMNRTVGFTVAVGAQLILSGDINRPGVLSPARDVPAQLVLAELEKRGITVTRR